jgi:uncharacterized membrane protein
LSFLGPAGALSQAALTDFILSVVVVKLVVMIVPFSSQFRHSAKIPCTKSTLEIH